ncbi:hypothetical protein [Undibacterium sp. Ren11W]|uniref:hypothetical protein n=1 Tax=Undibacterium sp. Ren11W TaxID=3413045 RepID=UPI003BF21975
MKFRYSWHVPQSYLRQAFYTKEFMKPIRVTSQVKIDPIDNPNLPLLPHDRDEQPDVQPIVPRKIMKQAYKDLQRCLVDTDLHGQRGVEEVVKDSKKREDKK